MRFRIGMRTVPRGSGRTLARAAALVAAIAVLSPALAQTPFSLVNLGANLEIYDARTEGRGGWAMAETDTLIPSFKNVASLVGLRQVAISFSGFGETLDTVEGPVSRDLSRVFTPHVRAAIPLLGGRGALSAGFQARRATQYETLNKTSLVFEGETILLDELFVREGTQFDIPLGIAWRLERRLQAGLGINLVRGSIRESLGELFFDSSGAEVTYSFLPTSRLQEDELSGTQTVFALLATPHPRLGLGFQYKPWHDVEMKRTVSVERQTARTETTFDLRMPPELSLGGAYRWSDRWSVGADYDVRYLSEFSGYPAWQVDMVDEWTWSVGLERLGATVRRGGLGNLPLRLGVMHRRWGYLIEGEEVLETRLSLGTGFRFRSGGGHLDVAVAYGWRGDEEKNGSRDRYWRLTLSVSGLEKWW